MGGEGKDIWTPERKTDRLNVNIHVIHTTSPACCRFNCIVYWETQICLLPPVFSFFSGGTLPASFSPLTPLVIHPLAFLSSSSPSPLFLSLPLPLGDPSQTCLLGATTHLGPRCSGLQVIGDGVRTSTENMGQRARKYVCLSVGACRAGEKTTQKEMGRGSNTH